jgi:hypothetical protein
MHTTICTFDDKTRANDAVDKLVAAGFARHDLHIEHKHGYRDGEEANNQWDGLEREVAVDPHVVTAFGRFFARLFGHDHAGGHVNRYAGHVEHGSYVVVADTHDPAEAQRARAVLEDLQARDLSVVHRADQRPLRDIVATRQDRADVQAGMAERSREAYEGTGAPVSTIERERAMASNAVSPTTAPDLREPELERAPGLRYSDKDKPL